MRKISKVFLILLTCYIVIMGNACSPNNGGYIDIGSPSPPDIVDESFWCEIDGRFYTYNLSRAQEKVPFTIIVPSYLTGEVSSISLPFIDGPLSESNGDSEININISYHLSLGNDKYGYIFIEENNYPLIPENPEVNPDYEYIEILDKKLVKTDGDLVFGPGTIYYLNLNNQEIYWFIEAHNISPDESFKVVKSMVEQLE